MSINKRAASAADAGEKLAKQIGGLFAKCDVTSEPSVDAALAGARKAHGQELHHESKAEVVHRSFKCRLP